MRLFSLVVRVTASVYFSLSVSREVAKNTQLEQFAVTGRVCREALQPNTIFLFHPSPAVSVGTCATRKTTVRTQIRLEKKAKFQKTYKRQFSSTKDPQPTTSPSPSLSRPKPAFQPQTRCPGQTLPCSPNLVFQLQTRSEPKPAFQPEAGFPAVPTAQISLSRSKSCPPVENPVGRQSLLGWRESFLGWRAGFGLEGGCCRCPPSKQLV